MHIMEGIGMVWGAIRNPFPRLDREFRLIKETGAGVSNYNLYDRRIANRTVEWLKERADKDEGPWALYVGFAAPHPPFIVPREFLDHYPLDKVPMPKTYAVPGTEHHPWVKAQAEFIGQDKHFKDDEERRRAYASYLGLLSFVDAQVGFILDMLTQTGLAENTHVLYTSDHGDSPGARGLWGKFNFYEESAKVPMILSGPDVPDGVVCETPVSLIDCHATILDGLGVERLRTIPRRKAAHSSRLPIQTTHPTDQSSVNITPSPRRRAATCCVKANTSITTTSATGRNCLISRPTQKSCTTCGERRLQACSWKWSKASANVSIPKPSMLKRKRRKPPLSNATAVPIRPETSALPARHRCRAMLRSKSL